MAEKDKNLTSGIDAISLPSVTISAQRKAMPQIVSLVTSNKNIGLSGESEYRANQQKIAEQNSKKLQGGDPFTGGN